MGMLVSTLWSAMQGLQEKRILLLGLDGAGKTTILYSLRLGECVHTIPTIGFNVEHVDYERLSMTVWDVGGQEKIRRLWKHYYGGADALIFVLDANDRERVEEAAYELYRILEDDDIQRSCTHVLVYANKMDLPQKMTVAELVDKVGFTSHPTFRGLQWHVQGACAPTGEGLYEGLSWLSTSMKKHGRNGQV